MLPGTGLVDTAVKYGQSVYSWHGGFDPDELSAMPSVHVGWALAAQCLARSPGSGKSSQSAQVRPVREELPMRS